MHEHAAATPSLPPGAPAEDEVDSAPMRRLMHPGAVDTAARKQPPLKGISSDARRRLLAVPAVPLAGTALEGDVTAPAAVSALDLVSQVWPADAPNRPSTSLNICMEPEGACMDFAMLPGGAAAWVHVMSGRQALVLVPPLPHNLAAYAAWAAGPKLSAVSGIACLVAGGAIGAWHVGAHV